MALTAATATGRWRTAEPRDCLDGGGVAGELGELPAAGLPHVCRAVVARRKQQAATEEVVAWQRRAGGPMPDDMKYERYPCLVPGWPEVTEPVPKWEIELRVRKRTREEAEEKAARMAARVANAKAEAKAAAKAKAAGSPPSPRRPVSPSLIEAARRAGGAVPMPESETELEPELEPEAEMEMEPGWDGAGADVDALMFGEDSSTAATLSSAAPSDTEAD